MELTKKKWHSTWKNIEGMLPVLRNQCTEFLDAALKDNGNKEISIKTYCQNNGIDPEDFDESNDVESVYISYDGGSHPEFASTMYAVLLSVKRGKNGAVLVDLSEEDECELGRISTLELVDVCYFVASCMGLEFD